MVRQAKNPFHPGEILLEEFLEPKGLTQTALAEEPGWTRARLKELTSRANEVSLRAQLWIWLTHSAHRRNSG